MEPRSQSLTESLLLPLRQWQQYSDEEIAADLRELLETGGRKLEDFLPELERAAGINE